LCGLDYQQPVYTCGIGYTDRGNEEAVNAQKQQAREHAARLMAQIKAAAA
jgi:NAD(P)H dehydrogenase (quinone)